MPRPPRVALAVVTRARPGGLKVFGLTGGIGSGKSTVAQLFAARGVPVVDADALAREVLVPGAPAFDDVVAHFGKGVLDPSGAIDRTALGALMRERIGDALDSPAALVVADIPLLFERGRDREFEGTMLVYAPPATQLRRLRSRDGLDDAAAQRRLVAQLPIDEKRGRATWVIDNDGDIRATEAQIEAWWRRVVTPG